MKDKAKKIEELFERGVLLNKELLDKDIDENLLQKIELEGDLIVLNSDYTDVISQQKTLVDWYDIDSYRVLAEKERDDELYQNHLQHFKKSQLVLHTSQTSYSQEMSSLETALDETSDASFQTHSNFEEEKTLAAGNEENQSAISSAVTIVISFENKPRKYEVADFTRFFISRYRFLEGILRNRRELQQTMTINRVLSKTERETVSIIGVVDEIGETRTGNLIISLEDLTGKIKVLIPKNKKELYRAARDLVADEVIGLSGTCAEKIIFADSIIWPDIPSNHELKQGPVDEYVIFLSDIHVGSTLFLENEFHKFLQWLNGGLGNEVQRSIARKVKYIFIAGDLVDGVGIYPSQETELKIKDINGQYAEFARLISQVPPHIRIIICPGNHDAVHLAEPQPAFYQEFAPDLFNLPNVELVTNPSLVNIGKTNSFSGFDVLMYHGFSFDYYVTNVESIRTNGGYHRADLIMKFLLKRRHLAPAFKSTPYYPSHDEDPLLIKAIPDFFITGHIHYSSVANYKGITTISGSCWQDKTTFQEKLGHQPEPARVPVVNLKTREIKVMRFG